MKHIAIDPSMLGAKNPKPCVAYGGGDNYMFGIHIDVLFIVEDFIRQCKKHNFDTIIIEDGYCGFAKQSLGLAEARRRLEDAALRQGLTVHRLPITTWQAAMLGANRKGKCKERSCTSASALVGREITNDNEADAINMYHFAKMNPDFWEVEK